ncbi:hypothetical protein LWI28_020267 [Acer negundo]|uniref:Uncharacterized protein n=1 Tax=Acer negundo TaxID=4023 RepID=A0AAD5JA92_ACENE|nr:hypothetical protein LWI28_020267 [Acer negundo]KAK4853907.1 hypothetical protein QYF36_016287 [Acer negundo]
MKKMKRVAANSHHAEASARSKKQRLLEDYLELQKDFVSKKKKLQIAKQKKEILLAEVWFLRRKHKSFRIQSEDHEHEQDLVGTKKTYARSKLLPKNRSDSVLKSPSPAPDFNPVLGSEEQDIRKQEEDNMNPTRVEKKPKNCLFNKKRVGKKKTSWQDPEGLQV